jgi:hypothetical protein
MTKEPLRMPPRPRRLAAISVLAAALAGCGGHAVPPPTSLPAAPRPPLRMVITVTSATIDGHKPDGSAWDEPGAPPPPPQPFAALAGYFAAHPELAGTGHLIGEPVDVPGVLAAAAKSTAPDPMVFVEVAGRVFRSTLAPGQFTPVWSFPFVVELSPDSTETARITVVDWDGPGQLDVIGVTLVPVRDLVAHPTLELGRFGGVAKLILQIAPAHDLAARGRVAVPARAGWTEAGVMVVAGQEVVLRAAGEACTKGDDRSRCSGPEGQPRTAETSLPGFEARGHGALVGGIGDTRFFVGRDRRFVAPSSGPLLLSVNDADLGNNSGEFEVEIELR